MSLTANCGFTYIMNTLRRSDPALPAPHTTLNTESARTRMTGPVTRSPVSCLPSAAQLCTRKDSSITSRSLWVQSPMYTVPMYNSVQLTASDYSLLLVRSITLSRPKLTVEPASPRPLCLPTCPFVLVSDPAMSFASVSCIVCVLGAFYFLIQSQDHL